MRGLGVWMTGLVAVAAQASPLPDLVPAESPVTRCLQTVPGAPAEPAYPARELDMKFGGRVKVELKFAGPGEAPSIDVLDHDGERDFVRSVRAHAANLRVPCMAADARSVRLTQEYVFKPDTRRVAWTLPEDPTDADRRRQLKCVAHQFPGSKPAYPPQALRAELAGRIVLKLAFLGPDLPPRITAYSNRRNEPLVRSAQLWAEGLRMPCHEGQWVEALWTFVYRIESTAVSSLRDADLRTFLGAVKGIREAKASFDFNDMGCPFEVRMRYLRPHMPNEIGQLDPPRAERRPFLEWLSGLELDLPEHRAWEFMGDTMTIAVPCARLEL